MRNGLRVRRHVALALVSGALVAGIFHALYAPPAGGPVFPLSMASGYAGLLFLCVALVLGPWNVLRGRPNPVSTNLRRDVGIWAAVLGLVHVGAGLQVHLPGKPWLYFLYPPDTPHIVPLRHDQFGFANFAGLGATLVLVLLLMLSNDLSLRALGTRRWKALQRLNYVNFALVIAHSVAYQSIEQRPLVFVVAFSAMVLGVATMQVAGFRKKTLQSGAGAVDRRASSVD